MKQGQSLALNSHILFSQNHIRKLDDMKTNGTFEFDWGNGSKEITFTRHTLPLTERIN